MNFQSAGSLPAAIISSFVATPSKFASTCEIALATPDALRPYLEISCYQ
jgi:hypothetical protein